MKTYENFIDNNFLNESYDHDLILAARKQDLELIKNIINSKKTSKYARSNALLTISFSYLDISIEIAKELIKYGVNINQQDNASKDTPLMIASYCNNIELVRLYIKSGADLFIKNKQMKNFSNFINNNIYNQLLQEFKDLNNVKDFIIKVASEKYNL